MIPALSFSGTFGNCCMAGLRGCWASDQLAQTTLLQKGFPESSFGPTGKHWIAQRDPIKIKVPEISNLSAAELELDQIKSCRTFALAPYMTNTFWGLVCLSLPMKFSSRKVLMSSDGWTLAGYQMPTKATLSLPSSA